MNAKEVEYHPAPKWLTKEYLLPVLRKYKKDKTLEITNMEVKPATAKGENYASVMTRIKVCFLVDKGSRAHEESYIVKASYEDDPYVADIFRAYQPFQTEMEMYDRVLPILTKLLEQTGDSSKLFAYTVHVDYEHQAIIFEDLRVSRFVVADRLAGLDLAHCQMALEKLAKMHATAAVFNERSSGSLEKFQRGLLSRHATGFAPFFVNLTQNCAEFARECPELGSKYYEKLNQLREVVVEYGTRAYDLQPGHFHTLVHGDYWTNNMMLRYCDDDKAHRNIEDLIMIDFQFCNWTSPAIDLHYFFNTSLESQLRFDHQDELVHCYFDHLVATLRALNYTGHIPSLHEFHLQLESRRFYAVTSSIVTQPLLINDQTEDADFLAMIKDDERGRRFRRTLYQNKAIQRNLKKLLPIFYHRGLLDVKY